MKTKPCIITLGKFDGVHLGHMALINTAVSFAHDKAYRKEFLTLEIDFAKDFFSLFSSSEGEEMNMDVRLVTFAPHPYTTIKPEPFVPLMNNEDRLESLKSLGADHVDVVKFDKDFAKQKAEQFCAKMVENFNMKCLFIGHDCTMGSDRKGKADLQEIGERLGFCVFALAPVFADNSLLISSSRIRDAIDEGDVALAARLLGKPFTIHGTVVHGAKRGGDLLGFPTANMKIDTITPRRGVYATLCRILSPEYEGQLFNAVTNIGYNPTFANNKTSNEKSNEKSSGQSIETYLFDFKGDLYGKDLELCFIYYLRDEKKFHCVDELREQIKKDTQKAQDILG